jgi:hypothetical protein
MESKNEATETKNTKTGMPSKWHCDTYCRKVRHISCEGAKGISADAPDLCPFYDEMLY